ncbi:hypothetical protein RNZ50_13785 [Paracoccaceae bacterium Fryx2]|nr:hypothetical protein [Paracoccaceae bacterium Fryx2]
MNDATASTIAQLLFASHTPLNFALIVGEMDAALDKCCSGPRAFVWDCEDVAVFDTDGTRMVLGHSDSPGGGHAGCLTIAVGPSPGCLTPSPLALRHDGLCRLIVDRVQSRHPAGTVLWHQTPQVVTPDLVDALIDALPDATALSAPQPEAEAAAIVVVAPHIRRVPLAPPAAAPCAGNDRPDLPCPQLEQMQRVRDALYPAPEPAGPAAKPSTPMRLAVHTVNATLIVVSLPVGAALMTYTLLRGEDMQLSARVMAVTGTLVGLSHSPLGHQMMAAMV